MGIGPGYWPDESQVYIAIKRLVLLSEAMRVDISGPLLHWLAIITLSVIIILS